jgi:hypothetical protein
MSLRSEIRDAIDEIATPAPWLEDSVESFVRREDGRRAHRRSLSIWGWEASRRQTIGLIAAAMVVMLTATLVIGGRLWHERGNGEPSEAASIHQSDLSTLESSPLRLPSIQPGAACPFTPDYSPASVGPGPVTGRGHVVVHALWFMGTTDRGNWTTAWFDYAAPGPGVVLVRAKDLATNQPLVFAQDPRVESGAIAAGPVLGTDQLSGMTIQVRPEAVLIDPWHLRPANQVLQVMFAIPRATLCWGFQFDGTGFHETYVNGWDSAADKGN